VDSSSALKQQAGATPGKLVLIGVLAVVFAGVLYRQFGSSQADAPQAAATADAPTRRAPDIAQIKARAGKDQKAADSGFGKKTDVIVHWPIPEIATVTQYDPFGLPARFPQPKVATAEGAAGGDDVAKSEDAAAKTASADKQLEDYRAKLEELRHKGVQVIIKQHDEYAAMIGNQTYRVGDEIDGFKVVAIDVDGVHIARDLSK
jgi:hypothetical protein